MSNSSSIADPLPLGLAGFATATITISLINAGLTPANVANVIISPALWFGGIGEVLAAMWCFKKSDVFGATVFASYGFFWISLAYMLLLEANKIINFQQNGSIALGLFLLGWTIFSVIAWIGSVYTNNVVLFLMTFLALTFILLDVGAFSGAIIFSRIGGYTGIISALSGFYGLAACIVNSLLNREVIPIGNRQV